MRIPPRRRATIALTALATLLTLTACSGSSEKDAEKVREAILANAPGVEDAMVRYRTDIFSNKLDIRLSMPTTDENDTAALAAAIDSALSQAWNASPSEPSNIDVDVVVAPFAEGDRIGDSRAITLEDKGLDEALGLENDAVYERLVVLARELAERYGDRTDS